MAPIPIDRVHLVFKTHLDIGFTDFAHNVIQRYLDSYIPQAIELARALRDRESPYQLRWTTGSWLVYHYLEQASPANRRQMEAAIIAGDIVWHALPFTTHTELMTENLFRFGLSLSQKLDQRFGKQTIAAKMTDVPGHTRAMLPLLAEAGVEFLHIGINEASAVPDVPPVFRWRDEASDTEIVLMVHESYGELSIIPGFNEAISVELTGDNLGPLSEAMLRSTTERLQQQFPEAGIIASTLDDYAIQLRQIRSTLPVVTAEIGDTWIHGVGTDPVKVSQYRALCRLQDDWVRSSRVAGHEAALDAMNQALIMIPEHTWGLDVKTHLANFADYAPADFKRVRATPPFQKLEASWVEQRAYVDQAVAALAGTDLQAEARSVLADLVPAVPDTNGFERLSDPSQLLETTHFQFRFDPQTGAIMHLVTRADQHLWADVNHPLALPRYEAFSQADYDRYWMQYIRNKDRPDVVQWAVSDYAKPGMGEDATQVRFLHWGIESLYRQADDKGVTFLLELKPAAGQTDSVPGAPRHLFQQITFSDTAPVNAITLQWFAKPALRLPEAMWLSFQPVGVGRQGWRLHKLGSSISPLDVVSRGNRALHAVDEGVSYTGPEGQLRIRTLDAPLVAPGRPSLLDFPDALPDMEQGMHFNLLNNIWGTNFPQWIEGDARFRFELTFSTPGR